jgi:hypothetical protein
MTDEVCSESGLEFLRQCYYFLSVTWPHAARDEESDSGFESGLRDALIEQLPDWNISQPREMGLGLGLTTASDIQHEIDVVATHDSVSGIVELKQRQSDVVGKNDVIVFFAELVDYFCANPFLLLKELVPVFATSLSFEMHALTACLGLGIHPAAPSLRPYPMLAYNEGAMAHEVAGGIHLPQHTEDAYLTFASRVSALGRELSTTWVGDRFVHISDDQIGILAVDAPNVGTALELLELNSACTELLQAFRLAKTAPR